MRAQEIITEISRRDFLRGAGAAAGGAVLGTPSQAQPNETEVEETLQDVAFLAIILSKYASTHPATIELEQQIKLLEKTRYGRDFALQARQAQAGIEIMPQTSTPEEYKSFVRYYINNYQKIRSALDNLTGLHL